MSLSSPCVNGFADCDVESNLRSGLRRRQTASQESMSWPRSQLRPVRRQHDCRYAGVDTIHSTPHDPLNESVALWFDDSSKVCMRPLLKCDGECLLLTTGLCCDALTDSSRDGARQSLNLQQVKTDCYYAVASIMNSLGKTGGESRESSGNKGIPWLAALCSLSYLL